MLIVGLIIFSSFIIIFLWGSQPLYDSRHFFKIILPAITLCALVFVYLKNLRLPKPESNIPYTMVLILVYLVLLVLIKLNYKRLNRLFLKKGWIGAQFADKDFTWVTYTYRGLGPDIWNKKLKPPSLLDYIFSFSLLIIPMLIVLVILF